MSEYIVRETGYPGAVKQEVVGELVRCRDCKYFHYSKPYGILIMNLVCDKWGEGCRTRPDGFCFMGEKKE